ncbi:uncharacterized protein [Rutidosis leptorrhynchoides]|uniref:uncharacterized protein isoform X2 n=1 Tax=Rutidosis leptorrhynchoides TaxID=125765 RepID=UPI003A991A23
MMNKMQKLIHGGDATNNAAASSLIFRARPPQTRIVPIVDHRGRLRASSSPSPMDIISEKTEASSSTAAKSNNSNPHLEFELRKHWRVDWEPLDFVGLYESVEGLLRQKYAHGNNNEFSYYDDWLELIHCTDEYNVSKELCVEFYSSYKFKENVEGMNDEEFMRFELGGRPHQMSLKDFTSCLEIYSKERLSDDYIWSGVKISTHALKRGTQLQIYKTKEEIRDCAYKGTDDCAYEETAEKEKEEILRQHSYLRKGSQQMSLMRADDYAIYLPTSSY